MDRNRALPVKLDRGWEELLRYHATEVKAWGLAGVERCVVYQSFKII